MTTPEGGRVEARLHEAAADAAWPATPGLRALVLARIGADAPAAASPPTAASPPALGPAPHHPAPRPAVRLVRILALAAALALVVAGIAAALGYRLPGFDLVFTEPLPSAGVGLDLGASLPLAEALSTERPRVLAPGVLPLPDAAWVLGTGDRRIVTLVWRAAVGRPALGGSDLSLTVMAVPGDTDEGMIRKLVGQGTTIEAVTVNGDRGWWIAGAPHEILVLRPDGTVGVLRSALAGDTLVFARDGTLYRLESALGRDATLEIASSMR